MSEALGYVERVWVNREGARGGRGSEAGQWLGAAEEEGRAAIPQRWKGEGVGSRGRRVSEVGSCTWTRRNE